jgi:hypothetical protein
MDDEEPIPAPPRQLRGRRARKIWRELAPRCYAAGTLNAGSCALLAVLCTVLTELGEDPSAANPHDVAQARAIGKSLGIFR